MLPKVMPCSGSNADGNDRQKKAVVERDPQEVEHVAKGNKRAKADSYPHEVPLKGVFSILHEEGGKIAKPIAGNDEK